MNASPFYSGPWHIKTNEHDPILAKELVKEFLP